MVCRTCNSEVSRVRVVFEVNGIPLPEPKDECLNCVSHLSAGERLNDHKLWLMQDVNPHEYEVVAGEKRLKDWAQAELEARITRPDEDDERAIREVKERKRAQVMELRGQVPTKSQIENTANLLREQIIRDRALDAGLALPRG